MTDGHSSANLTSLVSVLGGIANTTQGMTLLGHLGTGNKTVFAPSNAAFAKVDAATAMNTTLLTEIVAYHILNNTYTMGGIAVTPANTIARTLLNFDGFNLPGNHSSPLVLSRNSTKATSFFIDQAEDNVTTTGPVSVANLQLYIIDEVLRLPTFSFNAVKLVDTPLDGLVNMTSSLYNKLDGSLALTIFAPTAASITAAMSLTSSLNSTQIFRVLENHVVNGTIVYSPDLLTRNYTSQGGQPISVMSNSSGTFVTSGATTAMIVKTDTILKNGVVHVNKPLSLFTA